MRPPLPARRRLGKTDIGSAVGLSADLPANVDLASLASRFGVGFVELGPVATSGRDGVGKSRLRRAERALQAPKHPRVWGLDEMERSLASPRDHAVPVGIRLAGQEGAAGAAVARGMISCIARLAPRVAFFTVPIDARTDGPDLDGEDALASVTAAARAAGRPVFAVMRADQPRIEKARSAGFDGVWIGGVTGPDGELLLGRPERDAVAALTSRIRREWPQAIIAGAGVTEPADAEALISAGADLAVIDAGLVVSGPGLPKRCNELIDSDPQPSQAPPLKEAVTTTWAPLGVLGATLIAAGLIAAWVSLGPVLLAHDEAFLGTLHEDLGSINPRLKEFLAHDRMSLAGATAAAGVLFLGLAWNGLRTGAAWNRTIIVASTVPGMGSFLSFSLVGYVDILDALGTLLMSCLFALAFIVPLSPRRPVHSMDRKDDLAWRMSLWGQLGMAGLAVGFIVAGLTIAWIGSTRVFVASDLDFLQATAHDLDRANGRLLPVVAHDRARFGGNLVALGVAILLMAMWCVRRGHKWLWWTFALAGIPGFAAGLGIHYAIGYVDAFHVGLPLVAAALFLVCLALLYPFLCAPARPHSVGSRAASQVAQGTG